MTWSLAGHWVSETLWPRRCPACGASAALPGADWCQSCSAELAALAGRTYCPACGGDASELLTGDGRCPNCRKLRLRHAELVRVGAYAGPLRAAVVSFKYRRKKSLDRILANLLWAALQGRGWFEAIDLIVPVPSHWSRRLARGYDHVDMLARQVAELSGKPVGRALKAAKRVRPQVGLSRDARFANVRGAFRVAGWVRAWEGSVCLVDDVTTTGATVHEAAATLVRAGLDRVFVAVVAKATIPGDRPSLM